MVPCRAGAPGRAGAGSRFGSVAARLVIWLLACAVLARAHEPELQGRGPRVANIKSQIKRNKQNEKRRLRNKSVKSSLKTAIRKFNEAVQSGDATAAETLLRDASRRLDKAASKGVIHKNQAANRKSAIAKRHDSLAA